MIRFACILALTLVAALPARAAVDILEVTSPGGITAWLVEERSIPFTALEVRFKGGASLDRSGKRGAMNLMTGLLEEGAGDLDATEFATARESLAASFGFDVSDDSVSISAEFLTENRDEALALLKLAITQPSFDAVALERVRGQVLSIIASDQKDPNHLAREAFDLAAFGDHPYGSAIEGTAESVAALTADDMRTAHSDALALDRVIIGAVGDISPEELGRVLDELLGDLSASGAPMPDRAAYQLGGGKTVVPFDTPQSVAVFGHEGIVRDDPDFFAAYILNEILGGGGFGSRLMDEVREKRGLTYGVGSYLLPYEHGSLYLGQVASSNDRVAQAIDVIKDEWRKMAEEGVTEEELERAKTYLTGAYPLRFDGNAPIARILTGMQFQDLPISYIATRNDNVNAVTLDDIKRVAARILRPDDLHFVVVGQPEGLETTN